MFLTKEELIEYIQALTFDNVEVTKRTTEPGKVFDLADARTMKPYPPEPFKKETYREPTVETFTLNFHGCYR